ncbi:glycosyltransferase family 2 protein [Candidatus Giovannonibacteria bacterium]|nr:glycosyltransferase family 2 protein [Candidatus Giovannonibacteria bacterium]
MDYSGNPERIFIIVPAFNESRTISKVLDELKKYRYSIIAVDDGSTDGTYDIASNFSVILIRHEINRGLGASLQTGFKKAHDLGAEFIVTFDADGQHRASDIPRLLEPLINDEADVAVGSRNFSMHAPIIRKAYNKIANLLGYVIFGIYVSDTQSGLRAFKMNALEKFRALGDRMEISSEIIGEIGRLKLRLKEIPIDPVYTEYSLSKGQSFKNGIKTFIALIMHKLKM